MMSLNTKTLFSSNNGGWETPHDVFDALWDEFGGFDLDPCCQWGHHTAQRIWKNGGKIYVPADKNVLVDNPPGILLDGLAHPWHGKVYLNPPYGREIGKWIEKAYKEVQCRNAELVVALLPARTDTKWWQTYILNSPILPDETRMVANEVRFLPGRLKFVGAENAAPFPSVIVIWRKA